MCLWKKIRQRTGRTKDYFRNYLRRWNCFSMSKAVCCIVNLLRFHKVWNVFTILGATQMCHCLKVDIRYQETPQGRILSKMASWKVSVAKRLSFPGGFIFTIPAPFYFCSIGTRAINCCWKEILCFKNEDKISWQAAKDNLKMSGALQSVWSQLQH